MNLKITATELKKRLDKRKIGEDKFVLIDVRSKNEQDISKIPETDMLIPITEFEQNIYKLEKFKNEKTDLVVYCRVGIRSYSACELLYSRGFTKAFNLVGGILSYIEEVDSSLATY